MCIDLILALQNQYQGQWYNKILWVWSHYYTIRNCMYDLYVKFSYICGQKNLFGIWKKVLHFPWPVSLFFIIFQMKIYEANVETDLKMSESLLVVCKTQQLPSIAKKCNKCKWVILLKLVYHGPFLKTNGIFLSNEANILFSDVNSLHIPYFYVIVRKSKTAYRADKLEVDELPDCWWSAIAGAGASLSTSL